MEIQSDENTLHPSPFDLHPSPFTLRPTPFTLRPTPCTLHPTPSTLHPPPSTLHTVPGGDVAGGAAVSAPHLDSFNPLQVQGVGCRV